MGVKTEVIKERSKNRISALEKKIPSRGKKDGTIHIEVTEEAVELWERICTHIDSIPLPPDLPNGWWQPDFAKATANELATMKGTNDAYLLSLENVMHINEGLKKVGIYI